MRCVLTCAAFLILATSMTLAGEVSFTDKPAVKKNGDVTTVSFAVSAPTDVAVFIEDANGKVVRHLAAGVLGKNPPAPLKADALAQSIEWDGKDDDGKPAEGGPFRARVGLGLKVNYAGPAFMEKSGPNELNGVWALAVAPDGRLFVMDDRAVYGDKDSACVGVHVFRRDGAYERTIYPFPSNLPIERVKASGAYVPEGGRITPLVYNSMWWHFSPFKDLPLAQMAVADGKVWLAVDNWRGARLAAIDFEGGMPSPGLFPGPALGTWAFGQPRIAAGSDGQTLYLTGAGGKGGLNAGQSYRGALPFVAKVKLPEAGPAEIAFGDLKQTGNDNAHLNEPRGLAVDGQGHLLVCDSGNNRVVVLNEKDMSFAGSFEVPKPEWVGCHPKTGAVYVAVEDALVKFSGWKEPKELARLNLADHRKGIAKAYMWSFGRCYALDAAAEPPVLWIGQAKGEGAVNWKPLLRCEDRDGKFTDPVEAGCYYTPFRRGVTVDPYRREVACQEVGTGLSIMNEATGKIRKLTGVAQGGGINRLGPDGAIYSNCHFKGLRRWDRDGKPKPFEVTDPKDPGAIAGMAGAMGTTIWERDYYIDRKNDIYTKLTGAYYHGLQKVCVFGQDGKFKRTAIWGITDGSYGPRIDPKGNLYMMEAVKPQGEPFPAELKPFVTKGAIYAYNWMYGSIIKFGPQGGNLQGLNLKGMPDEVAGKDKPEGVVYEVKTSGYNSLVYGANPVPLPDSAKKIPIEGTNERRNASSYVQGAEWVAPGVGYTEDMGDMGGGGRCHCVGCDFDVDDFGRTFAPDNGRFRVTVFDTNGNVILHFGAYGNQDCWGPDSYVLDPATKLLRPRKADDPKDLKSPFAEPEIAFARIVGLAVTEKHVYVADYKNRRVLRCSLGYAAEAAAEAK